jgi:hypothetical protein
MLISTYNQYHLGDNLHSLNYLRRVALSEPHANIKHYCPALYFEQLLPLLSGVPNLGLFDIESAPFDSINLWIGRDNYYFNSPLKKNWANFFLDFSKYISEILNVSNPISSRDDLLFDYPDLNPINKKINNFDFLIINSTPLSGQIHDYSDKYLINLTAQLINLGYSVITTHPTGFTKSTSEMGLSITEIGLLSSFASCILGVPNGPMWPTFNVFNKNLIKRRIIWLSSETLNLTDNCICVRSSHELDFLLSSAKII